MEDKIATLSIPGHDDIELPMHQSTMGQEVIDVNALIKHGLCTFDPGFISTASCESSVSYIDGAKGTLLYRGYPIEQLAEKSDHMDVCYLLMYGELPTHSEKENFINTINKHTMVHEQMSNFFNGFRRDAHPMAVMVGVVGGLSAFYQDSLNTKNPQDREYSAYRLIAKMPTIAAMCYKYSLGQPFIYPQNHRSYADNFLHMMFSVPAAERKTNAVFARAMDKIFILHADHGQNASTSTVRVAGSTGANPFACLSAGIGALWGPAHGGANEACLNMLREMGSEKNIGAYIKRAKDPDDPFRLMGFGHRVYKNIDPRAKVMQQACYEVLHELGHENDPVFKLAKKLEQIATEDDYFVERKLYPNVDFYSGITLDALGIPTNMFTVIFAVSRTVGWVSQWMEMMSSPKHRLSRPRQFYIGKKQRDVS